MNIMCFISPWREILGNCLRHPRCSFMRVDTPLYYQEMTNPISLTSVLIRLMITSALRNADSASV